MTNRWPRLQFVDSPDVGATVRYDFKDDDGIGKALAAGFSLGTPSLDGDPDSIGTLWGFRTIQVTQRLLGRRAVVLGRMAALRREMYRQKNWLLFQLDEFSDPVWFRIYRSASGPADFDQVRNDDGPDYWRVELSLRADPWAVGPLVTQTFTYQTDPYLGADESGRMGFYLPPVKGDVAVPLRVEWFMTTGAGDSIYRSVADGWLAVSQTAEQSRVYWDFTASSSSVVRAGAAPSAVAPGRYRVASIHAPGASDERFGISVDGGTTTLWATDAVVSEQRDLMAGYVWRDLGDVTIRSSDGEPITPYIRHTWTSGVGGDHVIVLLVPIVEEQVGELASVMEHILAPRPAGDGTTTYPDHFIIDDSDDHDHQCIRGGSPTVAGNLLSPQIAGASQLIGHPQWENLVTSLGHHANDGGSGKAQLRISYRPRRTDVGAD